MLRLKPVTVHSADGQVVISTRALSRVYLADPTGAVATLVQLLAEAGRDEGQLRAALAERGHDVTEADLDAALNSLDELGVLHDDQDASLDAATRERHHSNLRWYDVFARRGRSAADFHRSAAGSRVLLLGVGGLGSSVLQSLVGLGVGTVVIVDIDTVEPRNLARQFVYGLDAVGRPKVDAARDWVASYSPGTTIVPYHQRITDVSSVVDVGRGADIVVSAIDTPDNIRAIVNEACFELGVPYVGGGLSYSTMWYYSVVPRHTPCLECLEHLRDDELAAEAPILRAEPMVEPVSVNRGTGPAVQLLSGLMTMEMMRYLTRTEPPVAAARYQVLELADGMRSSTAEWPTHPGCRLCKS
jgi:molybdopterin/thiamine biosynthesis adenylyltransferase